MLLINRDDGLTVSNIIFDEFAFMKYNDITYKAAAPAFSRASENAKAHGTPYGIVITTTPNNIDEGTPGAFCYDMIQNAAKWTLDLFDLAPDELTQFIESNSMNNFIFVQYTYKELGRSEAWLEQQKRLLANDTLTLKREVLLVWPHSTDGAVFTEDQLTKVFSFVKPPLTSLLIFNKYPIVFYEQPDLSLNYILSCDVSGGLSSDNSVINIVHPEDFRIVGDFRNSKIDTDTFRRVIEELMTLYLRNSVLVIEKTGIGSPLIDTLIKNPQIEPRMYREEKEHLGERTTNNGFVVKRKSKTMIYGVDTTKQTRDQMMDLLFDIVDNEYDKLISENIYRDLVTLEKKRNGKIEHAAGKHDDSLMAYLIFRWAVFYGKCFQQRFHISPVPSRANVQSSKDDSANSISAKMTRIFNTVDSAENAVLINQDVYNDLLDRQRKIADKDSDDEQARKANAFARIAAFNSDDYGGDYNAY